MSVCRGTGMRPLPEVAAPSPRVDTLHTSGTSDVYTAPLSDGGPLAIVKRTKITCARDIERFERELELLCAVAHECVIRPVGVVHAAPTYALVLPFFSRGSLFRLLHNSATVLPMRCRVSLALDSFAAVAHLHAAGVIHRDIKPDNLLIADDGRAVLTDFNAAEFSAKVTGEITVQARPTGGFFKQFVVGTLPYMAPELLRRGGTSGGSADFRPCDVYSLGITTNEIVARCIPYADALTERVQLHTILEARYNHDDLVTAITTRALRPALPPLADGPAELIRLVQLCWAEHPEARPTAAAAEASIRSLLGKAALAGDMPPRDEIAGLVQPASALASTWPPAASAPFANAGTAQAPVALPAGGTSAPIGAAGQSQQGSDGSSGWAGGAGASLVQTGASGPALTAPRDVFGDSVVAALARACGATEGPPHRAAAEATAGKRGLDRMEDRHSLAQAGGLTIAAVFDGHGGDGSSSFCAAQIVPEIERAFRHAAAADSGPGEAGGGGECGGSGDPPGLVTSRMSSALRSCFVTLNARFLSCFPSDTSGCTALAVVVLPHVVLAANAGDCRAYLWREDGPLLPLSREHIASDEAERARVLQLGGAVQATIDGKLRVGGVIQVTRCIGDRDLRSLGLSSEPEIVAIPRGEGDLGVVLASDGLWDVLTEERTLHCLRHTARSADMLAKRLVFDAMDKGTDDNVTCAVVLL